MKLGCTFVSNKHLGLVDHSSSFFTDIELLKKKEQTLEELVCIASQDLESVASAEENKKYPFVPSSILEFLNDKFKITACKVFLMSSRILNSTYDGLCDS